MIVLYSKKSNTNFKKQIQIYLNTANFNNLECPNCHSHNFIRWGHYERNILFFSNVRIIIESSVIKIQRVMCKSCNKTHALLPFGIIPYKQFTDEVISKIFLELTNNSLEEISNKYFIDHSIIKKWINQYRYHRPKINTFMKSHNNKKSIMNFLNNLINKVNYIKKYNLCFMQIKLGCLGLCSS